MATTAELQARVDYAIKMVRDAHAAGLITAAQRDERLRELGVRDARTVTIAVQVTGDTGQLNAYRGEVNREVERVLSAAAGRVGLTVVAGTADVRV